MTPGYYPTRLEDLIYEQKSLTLTNTLAYCCQYMLHYYKNLYRIEHNAHSENQKKATITKNNNIHTFSDYSIPFLSILYSLGYTRAGLINNYESINYKNCQKTYLFQYTLQFNITKDKKVLNTPVYDCNLIYVY